MNLDPKTLDRLIPLESASHAEATGFGIDIPMRYAECVVTLADGRTARLKKRSQLLGWSISAKQSDYYFRCGEKIVRISTDAARRRQIRHIDGWSDFNACQALSAADPRVRGLGGDVHKIVSPDGSLLFIAPAQPSTADLQSFTARPLFQPTQVPVSIAN
jgi:hypothetical protein